MDILIAAHHHRRGLPGSALWACRIAGRHQSCCSAARRADRHGTRRARKG